WVLWRDTLLRFEMQSARGRQVRHPCIRGKITVYRIETAAAGHGQCAANGALEIDLLRHFGESTPHLYRRGKLDLSVWRQLQVCCRHLGLELHAFLWNLDNIHH